MRLFPMRTFPASANGESCLGPVFRPLTDSDQHSFRYSYVISVFLHFLHKITNESVFEISIDIFSELIVSALKTDKCHGLQSLPPSPKRAEHKGRRRPFREAGSGHKQWNTVSCVDTFLIISKFRAQNSKI